MIKLSLLLMLLNILIYNAYAMVPSMPFEDKCSKSDLIIQGHVINIIDLSVATAQRGKVDQAELNKNFIGPNSVALVHVKKVIKGNSSYINKIIYIPCGYNLTVSPCELTKSIEYVFFLKNMDKNFYHPIGPFCMHRISGNKIGLSGFDWLGDFDSKSENGESMQLDGFIEKIKNKLLNQKAKKEHSPVKPLEGKPE